MIKVENVKDVCNVHKGIFIDLHDVLVLSAKLTRPVQAQDGFPGQGRVRVAVVKDDQISMVLVFFM